MAAVFAALPAPDLLVRRHHNPPIPEPRPPPPPPLPRRSQQPLFTGQKQKQKQKEQQQQQQQKHQQTRRRRPSPPSQGHLCRDDAPAAKASLPPPPAAAAATCSSRPARPPPPLPPQNTHHQTPRPVLLLRDRLSTLITDPRLRVQLGITPDVNPALLRPPTQHPPPTPSAAPSAKTDEGDDELARPALNSTRALHAQTRRAAAEQFDPVAAVQALMEVDGHTVRDVQSRITAKSLNIRRTHEQYHNLARIPSASSSSPSPHHTATITTSPQPPPYAIPRAKKSVPKAYLAARAPPPPPFLATESLPQTQTQSHHHHHHHPRHQQHLELDTISLPYPQEGMVSPYHAAAAEPGEGGGGGGVSKAGENENEPEEAVGPELPRRETDRPPISRASSRNVGDILRRATTMGRKTTVGEMMDVEDWTRWQWYLRPVRVEDF
ncbi:hypothetical protein HDU87_001185 [Geranomyces variabilis]|uniref:Uncharacterized protein n=1 Tax=Geranomyces variabilis TaxID=109894 RepID=A0AAD5TBW7_9FUNG|nr:hypothetical protein HDU87_001185 [Geranomyces variabilis]